MVVALGVTQTLAWASSYYLPAILARPMAESLGLSTSVLYGFFSASLLLAALLGPWVGRVVDSKGGRGVLLLSNLSFAAGLVALSLAQGLFGLALGWGLIGIGMALGLYEVAFATLAGLFGEQAKGPITGITLLAGFASTIGWPLSAWMLGEFGWRGACLGWALMHIVLGLPLHRWLVPAAPPPVGGKAQATAPRPAPSHAMAVLIFFSAAVSMVVGGIAAHMPGLMVTAGATPEFALFAAAMTGPAQVGARLLQFSFLRGMHPLVLARIACAMQAAGGLALLLLGAPGAVAFALLHGAGSGMNTIARGTLPLAIFGPAGYGARQGIIAAPGRVLQAGAPLGFGLLVQLAGPQALWSTVLLALAAVVALFALRPGRA